jgi:hypothetical protein
MIFVDLWYLPLSLLSFDKFRFLTDCRLFSLTAASSSPLTLSVDSYCSPLRSVSGSSPGGGSTIVKACWFAKNKKKD